LSLRQRYFAQRQEGDEAVFIDRETMLEEISERWPEHRTDRSAAIKKSERGIDCLVKADVLLKTVDQDRFRISPIIEVRLPVEKLHELLAWLMDQNGTSPEQAEDALELDGLEDDQGDET